MRLSCLLVLLCAIVAVGCAPYPRYRTDAESNPREQRPTERYLSTSEFMELGMILQRHLGRPYKGRSKWETGVDCSKFTRDVFSEYNKTVLPATAADQFTSGEPVPRPQLRFGDLVFFRTERSRISHVGIFVGHNEFIHASTSRGVIITDLSEEYWAQRYAGARRVLRRATD